MLCTESPLTASPMQLSPRSALLWCALVRWSSGATVGEDTGDALEDPAGYTHGVLGWGREQSRSFGGLSAGKAGQGRASFALAGLADFSGL